MPPSEMHVVALCSCRVRGQVWWRCSLRLVHVEALGRGSFRHCTAAVAGVCLRV